MQIVKIAKKVASTVAMATAVTIGIGAACVLVAPATDLGSHGYSEWPRSVPERWPRKAYYADYASLGYRHQIWQSSGLRNGRDGLFTITRVEAGFPLKCLRHEEWDERHVDRSRSSSSVEIETAGHPRRSWLDLDLAIDREGAKRIVPTSPCWSGLLADTAMVAIALGGFRILLHATIQRRRRRQGRCVCCGYAGVQGDQRCPECGKGGTTEE